MSVVALSGGVGGAKLSLGLYRTLPPGTLTVVVNTGDDFDHLGLHICPDLDTMLYTLAGLANPAQGWGRRNETWSLMHVLEALGEETWFQLGDADTALHIVRTWRLQQGVRLSEVMSEFRRRLDIEAEILPMSDSSVATWIDTDAGELAFQDYFVRCQCQPSVRGIRFGGAENARVVPAARDALTAATLEAIVICPSNPYLSIDPLLAIPELRTLLLERHIPCIAVSPLIGSAAIKGPTAKIMKELGLEISNAAIARHYDGLIDALVIDPVDAGDAVSLPVPVFQHPTLMSTLDDRTSLARFVMDCAQNLWTTC